MNFFPFSFLLEEAAPTVAPGEEEDARKDFSIFQNKNISQSNSLTQIDKPNEDSDDTQGSNERNVLDIYRDIGPTENEQSYFDINEINEEVDQGARNLWNPQVKPSILEDLSNNEKSILWNSKDLNGEIKTVGITFIVNAKGEIVWVNEETFREEFAKIILSSQESIRTLYYIIHAFLDEIGNEETVTSIFSQNNTINMTQEAWFYWRVEKQFLQVTPIVGMSAFIEKHKKMNDMFDVFHQRIVDKMKGILTKCETLHSQNQQQMQLLADSIESKALQTQQQIEAITNESIEHMEVVE